MNATVVALGLLAAQMGGDQEDEGKNKWKPYQFKGNERYEFKIVQGDDEGKKETGYVLDIRKKDDDRFEVTWSVKSAMKKDELGEKTAWGLWAEGGGLAWTIMNPMYGALIADLELKEGEKMSLFGMGSVKVTGKETVGGRTGLTCKLFTKEEKGEKLAWEWVVDPELALPIKSVTYEDGKAKSRAELVSYKKD